MPSCQFRSGGGTSDRYGSTGPPGTNGDYGENMIRAMSFRTKRPPTSSVAYVDHNIPTTMPANTLRACWLSLENRGSKAWRQDHPNGNSLGVAIYLNDGCLTTVKIPGRKVHPSERVTLHWTFRSPAGVGRHVLKIVLVGPGTT